MVAESHLADPVYLANRVEASITIEVMSEAVEHTLITGGVVVVIVTWREYL